MLMNSLLVMPDSRGERVPKMTPQNQTLREEGRESKIVKSRRTSFMTFPNIGLACLMAFMAPVLNKKTDRIIFLLDYLNMKSLYFPAKHLLPRAKIRPHHALSLNCYPKLGSYSHAMYVTVLYVLIVAVIKFQPMPTVAASNFQTVIYGYVAILCALLQFFH